MQKEVVCAHCLLIKYIKKYDTNGVLFKKTEPVVEPAFVSLGEVKMRRGFL